MFSQVGGKALDSGTKDCGSFGYGSNVDADTVVKESEHMVSLSSESAGSCVRVPLGSSSLVIGVNGIVGNSAEHEFGESLSTSVDVVAGGRAAVGRCAKVVQGLDFSRSGGQLLDSEATLSGTVMGLKLLVGGQRLRNSKVSRKERALSVWSSGFRGSYNDGSETLFELPVSRLRLNSIKIAHGKNEGVGQYRSSSESVEESVSVEPIDADEVNSGVARNIWHRAKCLGLSGGGPERLQIEAINVRELADKCVADVCFIQETKIHAIDVISLDSFWNDSIAEWSSKWAVGRSGGILTLWKKNSFALVASFVGEGFLGIHVLWSGINLFLVNVYSSCFIEKKRVFWARLVEFKSKFPEGLWCVGGDFNTVRVKAERKGISNNFNIQEAEDFEGFISSMNLVDVPMINKRFTWFNLDGSACSRLDRFLISEKLFDLWGVGGIVAGDRSISDHCPIWLNCNFVDWGPKPFKFFKGWCEHDDFIPLVSDIWINTSRRGKASFILKEKLLAVKSKLKSWNKEVFGLLDLNVEKAVGALNSLDLVVADLAEDGFVDSLRSNREMATKEVWNSMLLRDNFLHQKARCNWIRLGDSNSKFFHSVMKGRFRRNNIVSLVTSRGRLEGVEEIKSEIFNHFKSRFTEPMEDRPTLDGLNFNVLSVEDRDLLEAPFQVDEIKEIVWLSDCDKSPGPDGFPLGFLKKCWNFVKEDVVNFVQEFYVRGVLPRSATASFLALIPKVDCPISIDEYRLAGMMRKAVSLGSFKGFVVSEDIHFEMLQFADDTVLVCDGSKDNLWCIKTLLRGFELVSGLCINLKKSKLYGVHVEDFILESASSFLACKLEKIPFTFLGIPIGGNHRRRLFWSMMLSKMKKRLSGWRGKQLSLGGKVTLLNSVINNLPIFLLSFFKAPKCVLEDIIKIQRNFLWGDGGGSRKMCWVSWDKICLKTEEGGLGVKHVEWFNLSLMSKWGWRFLNDKHAIWFNLLQFRYGSGLQALCDVVSKPVLSNYSLWWRDIRLVCGTPFGGHDWFCDSISCKLGRGNSFLAWKHCWLGNISLKLLFPRLFEVCSFPNALVINCGLWENEGWSWKVGVDSNLLVGELLEDWKELTEILKDVKPCLNEDDKLIWWRDVEGFSVRNAFKRLYSLNAVNHIGSEFRRCELKRLWKAIIPCKVKLFGWRWILGALPTRKELSHRGVILGVEGSFCPLCELEEEFVGHLFLKCCKVKTIWKDVFSWFGVVFDDILDLSDIGTIVTGEDVLLFLSNSLDGKVKPSLFAFIWSLVCWSIWNARNNLVFKHSIWNVVEILLIIKSVG
ncbi:hypothetical protein KIW84_015326 [Lathyrus oleraceus]|uniref:Reverse transcriptase domain-containing protein n=1 Tax=Pisum sativum TaxID=3888 RepID=A0A9D5BQ04_PEA|nr:hypothetical protein KIW84_015326 [Pisum sativum]